MKAMDEEQLGLRAPLGAIVLGLLACTLVFNPFATPYDDSFFFKRVALHALHGAGFSWNVGEGPVYGLTSQLFALCATILTWLFPHYFVLASKVFSAACLVWFADLLGRWAARAGLSAYDAALLLGFTCMTPLTLLAVQTGMETTLCLALVALTLSITLNGATSASHGPICAVLTALVYTCRPDAALIPALAFLFTERKTLVALRYVVVLGALLGLLLLAFRLYYGSALPLPFYAKSPGFSAFDGELRAAGLHDKFEHLCTFALFGAPLAYIGGHGRERRGWALLGTSAIFVLYQALVTNEIMGYLAR